MNKTRREVASRTTEQKQAMWSSGKLSKLTPQIPSTKGSVNQIVAPMLRIFCSGVALSMRPDLTAEAEYQRDTREIAAF
jgi:hypothetical protein